MKRPNKLSMSVAFGASVAIGMFILNHPSSPDKPQPESNSAVDTAYDPDSYTFQESAALSLAMGSLSAIAAGVVLSSNFEGSKPVEQPASPKLPTELSVEEYRRRFAGKANELPLDNLDDFQLNAYFTEFINRQQQQSPES